MTNNKNMDGAINFVEDKVIHIEHWQGLHCAMCRFIQGSIPVGARMREAYTFNGARWYAVEWRLDGLPITY